MPVGFAPTGTLGTTVDTITYTYGDTNWGDLLTAYDGTAITYDGIGNPLSDGTWTYTWRNGRELATMTSGSTTWNYTYDANGMRTKRTNGSTTYTYVYNGGQLSQMTCGSNTLLFTYDATGAPVAVTYNGTVYYYVTTLQGDVQMIIDLDGEEVVSYVYDAWGRLISTTGSMASTLGIYNPLRYRGYVYDRETGLYYLQSRYYNPTIGRFINADAFTSTGQGLLGNNMFAYCLNNPVVRIDPTGSISYTQIEDPNDNNNPLDDVARIGTGSISKGTFRAKLAKLTGVAPTNSDAHHIFPRKFTAEFSSLGINNQDPIYGSWVNSAKHAKFSYAYNQWWTAFFGMNNVTASDAFALVDFLSVLFGFDLNY